MKFTEFNLGSYIKSKTERGPFRGSKSKYRKLIPIVLDGKWLVGELKICFGKPIRSLPIFQTQANEDKVSKLKRSSRLLVGSWRFLPRRQIASHFRKSRFDCKLCWGTDKSRQISEKSWWLQTTTISWLELQAGFMICCIGRFRRSHIPTFLGGWGRYDNTCILVYCGWLLQVFPQQRYFSFFSHHSAKIASSFLKNTPLNPVMEQIKTKTVISDTIDNWRFHQGSG